MSIVPLALPGVFLLDAFHATDERGTFVKTLHGPTLVEAGLESEFPESFYSTSKHGVLRGMHFQRPPHDHAKLVHVVAGEVLDAVIDLRREGGHYGQAITVSLQAGTPQLLYIPRGCAHGFCTVSEEATMLYFTSTPHAPESDAGIRWDSAGSDWPGTEHTVSERDAALPALSAFETPFLT